MRLFLTGASGFLGKNFCKIALKRGYFIYATSRKRKKNKIKNLKWLQGDFNQNWKKEMSNSDLLVHLAADGLVKKKKQDIYETNIFKSISLLKNAIKYNCKNWLIISTSSEYGTKLNNKNLRFSKKTNRIPDDDYGLSKAIFSDECIKLAKKFKCKVRIMRVFPVYGKGENKNRLYPSLLRAAKHGKNFFLRNPLEKRDFSNVKFVSKSLCDATDFNKKKFKFFQIWHVSQNQPELIKNFAERHWRTIKAKGKLIINKKNNITYNHISNINSLWK